MDEAEFLSKLRDIGPEADKIFRAMKVESPLPGEEMWDIETIPVPEIYDQSLDYREGPIRVRFGGLIPSKTQESAIKEICDEFMNRSYLYMKSRQLSRIFIGASLENLRSFYLKTAILDIFRDKHYDDKYRVYDQIIDFWEDVRKRAIQYFRDEEVETLYRIPMAISAENNYTDDRDVRQSVGRALGLYSDLLENMVERGFVHSDNRFRRFRGRLYEADRAIFVYRIRREHPYDEVVIRLAIVYLASPKRWSPPTARHR